MGVGDLLFAATLVFEFEAFLHRLRFGINLLSFFCILNVSSCCFRYFIVSMYSWDGTALEGSTSLFGQARSRAFTNICPAVLFYGDSELFNIRMNLCCLRGIARWSSWGWLYSLINLWYRWELRSYSLVFILAYICCAVGILRLIRCLDLRVKVFSCWGMGVNSVF